MLILRPRNWTISERDEAEVVMTLNVMEANEYALTAADALRLSRELEAMARELIATQNRGLAEHERLKSGDGGRGDGGR